MSANSAWVEAMLTSSDPVVDLPSARARLAGNELATLDGVPAQRSARAVRSRRSWATRVAAGVAVASAASVVLVATGGAQDFLSLFQPSQLAPVPVTAADVRSLAGLASYGTVTGGSSIGFIPEPDAAAAGSAAGLGAPVAANLPEGTAAPKFAVVSGGVVTFTFSADLARAMAARAGGQLPAMPAGLDGSTLSVSIAPAVVVSYGVDPATLLNGGSVPSGAAFLVVDTRTPTVSSTGVTARQLEDYLLSVPGIPAGVASEIRAIGNPSQTIPVPIPIDLASGSSVSINGARGLLIGDSTGLGSAVIWQHNGVVYAIAGTLTTTEILGIARSTH
ncbi:MAG TPA: hypothetical protein VND54_06325 [Candidatus Saccharimonadales bacterium]|nr:hypothetical protein [Candidatus Saccharimonadales bacterium]